MIQAKAHAKLNLHLEVLHRRQDGYHEIETILQTIELHDLLTFHPTQGSLQVRCSHPDVPESEANLAHRAAQLLRDRLKTSRGVDIRIDKKIPVAAGLGGGSADAAATLRALPRLWGQDVAEEVLSELAGELGADVPFLLRGGTQLARGIGERLTPLSASGLGWYLVITPRLALSTTWVYEHLRMGLTHAPPRVTLQAYRALLSRFPERPWPGFNRLADVVFPAYPALHRLYLQLEETRPRLALMSGSGPTLFAIYSTLDQAREAEDSLDVGDAFSWIGRSTREGVALIEGGERMPRPCDR